ncbi:transcription initiation factor TFIID subunit 4-like isoform X2 [Oppia nitens]|uniref:transcription initiation factor TFIID subunit 4-like isoform X2 n=1 Tax=Oppia nitens TaxID=1686743 RepID=UPI0023DBB3F2|nr:transcription initiation factor TFIID subunit 4-like isoform X2 [Oppia nitens]
MTLPQPLPQLSTTSTTTTSTPTSLPGALPASGYISQSLPMSGVAANQVMKNLMSNGNTGLNVGNNTDTIRTPTTISLGGLTPSLVLTPNKNPVGVTPKPGQTLLIATTKDGPMIVQPSHGTPDGHHNNIISNNINNSAVTTTASVVTLASRTVNTSSAPHSGNVMQQLMTNSGNQIQLQLVTSRPHTPNANMGPAARTLAPRVVQLPHNVRLTPQLIRPGNTGFAGQGTITLPSNLVRAGTIFVKTENGQVHMVNVGPPPTPQTSATNTATTFRLQMPPNTGNATPNTTATPVRPNQQHIVLPVSMSQSVSMSTNKTTTIAAATQAAAAAAAHQPLHISTTTANQQAPASTPSQMSPNTAKKKCKNFLSTLIRLASDQPPNVANNVKNLIQGLIDDAIQPEDFTNQLQRELNSSPQPCLVPFLKKSLPYLRFSLMQKELTIEGVRPPPNGTVTLPLQTQNIPQIQIAQTPPRAPGLQQTVRLLTPMTSLMSTQPSPVVTSVNTTTLSSGGQRVQSPLVHNVVHTKQSTSTPSSTGNRGSSKSSANKSRSTAATTKEKEKKNAFSSSSLRDDDDINDVAAMGGVNLQEESQRILSNAETVGQQIRSCKDEDFLYTTPLHKKINQIANKYGLDECSPEVVSLVSHAVQERLKTLVEKLGAIAEHRQEQIKNYMNYDVLQDVKGQTMFLQELDRIEKRRHEEQEREVLIKAAKSRSKADDPDHIAIKLKAKEMQRQEMEELRQREANETALQAIGNPKKRLKTSFNSMNNNNNNSLVGSSPLNPSLNNTFLFNSSTPSKPMRRIKRVSLKDLHFLMEMEKDTVRKPMLYRAYLK